MLRRRPQAAGDHAARRRLRRPASTRWSSFALTLRPAGGRVLAVADLAVRSTIPCMPASIPAPLLAEADLVLVVDGLTPWIPLRHPLPRRLPRDPARPRPAVRRHAGARLPVRPRPGRRRRRHAGAAAAALERLRPRAAERRARELRGPARSRTARERARPQAEAGGGPPMSPELRQPPAGAGAARGRDPVLRARLRSFGDGLHAGRAAISASRPRAASAGACPRRWARSSPTRTGRWSPRSATAPTCSPTRPPATRSPRRWTCRC